MHINKSTKPQLSTCSKMHKREMRDQTTCPLMNVNSLHGFGVSDVPSFLLMNSDSGALFCFETRFRVKIMSSHNTFLFILPNRPNELSLLFHEQPFILLSN